MGEICTNHPDDSSDARERSGVLLDSKCHIRYCRMGATKAEEWPHTVKMQLLNCRGSFRIIFVTESYARVRLARSLAF